MAFAEVLLFGGYCALLNTSAKCRLLAVGRRTSGGEPLGSIGTWADALEGI